MYFSNNSCPIRASLNKVTNETKRMWSNTYFKGKKTLFSGLKTNMAITLERKAIRSRNFRISHVAKFRNKILLSWRVNWWKSFSRILSCIYLNACGGGSSDFRIWNYSIYWINVLTPFFCHIMNVPFLAHEKLSWPGDAKSSPCMH